MTVAQFECHPGSPLKARASDVDGVVSSELAVATFGSTVNVDAVQQMEISCTLRFAKTSDVNMYSGGETIVQHVSADGIISARLVAPNILYYKFTDEDQALTIDERKKLAASKAKEAQCPILAVSSEVVLPVLVYKGDVCIDFSAGTHIRGLEAYFHDDGDEYKPSPVWPLDLYTDPEIENLIMEVGGYTYARLVPGDKTEALTYYKAIADLRRIKGQVFGGSNSGEILKTQLPLCICNSEYRIAPIAREALGGADRPITTMQNTTVHAATLASHLSASHKSNSIGIAMQKIAPGHQGDLMLHDGM